MGLWMTDNMYQSFVTFNGSMFIALMLPMLGDNFALALGFGYLAIHSHYPNFDFGGNNLLTRFFGGLLGGEKKVDVQEFVTRLVLQFMGGLVGGILYCAIMDKPSGPAIATLTAKKNLIRVFFFLLIGNFAQCNILHRIDSMANDLQGSFRAAGTYIFTWALMAYASSGQVIGGATIDVGRMLASELIHKNDFEFSKFWVFLACPAAGALLAVLMVKFEDGLKGASGKEDAPAAKEDNV